MFEQRCAGHRHDYGPGLYKSGITEKIAGFILSVAGTGPRQIISTVSVTVGLMSGLMQHIGAAALFLPVMTGISKRERISISRLLMPMGFAALLGGTRTMVGTSSLIVLNDLLTARGLAPFGLFSVLPIGLVFFSGSEVIEGGWAIQAGDTMVLHAKWESLQFFKESEDFIAGTLDLTVQVLVLQVGLRAANSFVLPPHHVNALLMPPGGYRVPDYLRAGSILSILFVTITTSMLYVFTRNS